MRRCLCVLVILEHRSGLHSLRRRQSIHVAFADVIKEVLCLSRVWRLRPDVGMRCITVFEHNQGEVPLA